MEHRVTGKDVAAHAGVTTATVSNVLNGKHNVSEATRRRVLASVRELGYVPDQTAKTLRQRNGRSIGVVIEKNLSNPRYGRTVEGMLREASARSYRLTLCRNRRRENGMYDYLAAYYERQVDGIIFVSRDIEGPDSESAARVVAERIPFVALDCQSGSVPYTTIEFDYRGGARAATICAIGHGAKRVCYVRPAVRNAQEELREEGVRAACAEAARGDCLRVFTVDVTAADVRANEDEEVHESNAFAKPSQIYLYDMGERLCRALAGSVQAGDAVICSWAGWSNIVSRAFPLPGVIFVDLASDYLSVLGAEIFCEMPNFDAGVVSVDAAIDAIEGRPPQARTLPIACCDLYDYVLGHGVHRHAPWDAPMRASGDGAFAVPAIGA